MLTSELIQRHSCKDLNQLVAEFADFSAAVLREALIKNTRISLVVPGGQTPRHYLPVLARQTLPWQAVTVTLSDERWVATNHVDSNQRLVTECFLSYLPETTEFVGLKTAHDNPAQAIETVQQRLAKLPAPFSLSILGLGEDGHIASLFPGMQPDLVATTGLCTESDKPFAPSSRISLSLNALANSQTIVLVVTGKNKRHLLDSLLRATPDSNIPFVWLRQQTKSPIIIFETDATQ